ncbi:transposase [Corynebacterium glutamicum]|uniref:IS1380-like element ISCgl4 family transposase n=1 Tax=Corynebacterium glutamicum TaxID=1718 RepID=UPI0004F688C2|nr:IS1380-like element ISCgl4 family transposase [Corynebacterium glutamicum]AIK84989.1 transposase [Corynebacterium glutamicum]AIK87773.1 transposase [Corynebacterium glutamicum]QYR17070.1 IS1380-like element ISCgl4 family transposase [Corynebacterium glutamicum]QYR17305.1 IS1380-like element ISCgl4 family transposase [Corynebacterium glutamicum]
MQLLHTPAAISISFDDPNLISTAGLVPTMALAEDRLTVPTDKGANPGAKITTLIAGMVAGADSIDDIDALRHGGMHRLFDWIYAPSTLGSFLRAFTFGHVRQLDAVASRFLVGLATQAPALVPVDASTSDYVFIDVDDTIIKVHGHQKQGAGFGYSGIRGLNALLATVTTPESAPVVVAQRLRKGSCGSPRGAGRLIADAVATTRRLPGMEDEKILLRADSAFYGHPSISAAIKAGADVFVTVRMTPNVKKAIAQVPDDAWQTIKYTNAIFDEDTGRWISVAEVAEIPFTAFTSRKKTDHIPGRLVVRRIPELNNKDVDQPGLFDLHRFHAVFTTADPGILDTVAADKTHRQHAIIEQVNADVKASALAHMPSGVFTANSAWLVCAVMAFNLTRTAGVIAAGAMARATTATIRRKLVAVPARIARSARRLILHLPRNWRWETQWSRLCDHGRLPP